MSSKNQNLTRTIEENFDVLWKLFLNFLTLLVVLVIAFPMYWMVNSSLLDVGDVYNIPAPLLPFEPTISHFVNLFTTTSFPSFYVSSIVLTVGVVLLTTSVATLAGYGLTRYRFPYKRLFARSILFGYMFPPILLGIPMYIIWRQVGLINSYPGTILAVTGTGLPITIWIMWQFFQTVPITLEESAQMAGASRFRAFYEIALPIAKPGIVAISTFSYAHAWGAYTIPKILIVEDSRWPLTVGLDSFVTAQEILWPQIMASAAMALIPSLLFLYFLNEHWKVLEL